MLKRARDAYELNFVRLYWGNLSPILLLLFWGCLVLVGMSCRAGRRSGDEDSSEKQKNFPPDVVIIGAGAAGLSQAAILQRAGVRYVVLERETDAGLPWASRYHRLHLHTDKYLSALPFVEFPVTTPLYPSRMDVSRYLSGYWRMLNLNIKFNTKVMGVVPSEGRWKVVFETPAGQEESFLVKHVIVAIGQSSVPNDPPFAEEKGFKGRVMHSSSFKNGSEFGQKKVLVVGFGNSGMEIAIDLVEHGAAVDVSVRSPIQWIERDAVPDVIGGGQVTLAIGGAFLPLKWLDAVASKLLLPVLPGQGVVNRANPTVFTDIANDRPPVVDIGFYKLVKEGKARLIQPPKTWDGYDLVVKCTGYLSDTINGSLEAFIGEKKLPVNRDGIFFIGWNDLAGRIRHMTLDAAAVRDAILKQSK